MCAGVSVRFCGFVYRAAVSMIVYHNNRTPTKPKAPPAVKKEAPQKKGMGFLMVEDGHRRKIMIIHSCTLIVSAQNQSQQ